MRSKDIPKLCVALSRTRWLNGRVFERHWEISGSDWEPMVEHSDVTVVRGDHLAGFYGGNSERIALAAPFLTEGLNGQRPVGLF